MNPQKQIHKNKILWLFPTTKDKEIKLFTTQRNQSFFYYIVVWKTNALSWTSHRMYYNKQKEKKEKCSKGWGQFLEKLAVKSVNYRFI